MISHNQLGSILLDMGTFNKDLPFVHTTSIAFNGLVPTSDFMGISLSSQEEIFLKNAGHEIENTINKDILKSMSSFNEDYLDVMKLNKEESILKLCGYLRSGGYDYLIIPPWMGTVMDSSLNFSYVDQKRVENEIIFYIGDLWNIKCYVNSFNSWTSKELICVKKNHFSYNLQVDVDKNIFYDTLNPMGKTILNVRYNITYDSTGFMLLHFVDEYNPKYVQFNRDNKINDILS